jgi:hypothetical protein
MTRNRVSLMHQISVLYSWASNPDKDTISALSEKQASDAVKHLEAIWAIIDRRKNRKD